LNNLDSDLGGESGILTGIKDANVISEMQSHIHENISALNGFLANGQGKEMQPLAKLRNRAKQENVLGEMLTAEAGTEEAVRNRVLYHLTRIDDTILQIASGLGTTVASTHKE
jgi:hypothetical protein